MIIDLNIARQNIPGGESALQQMAQLMKSESMRLLGELQDSRSKQDAQSFQRAAHTLKSAAGVFGAESIVETARSLEETGKAGDISDTEEPVQQLAELIDRLGAELDAVIGVPG